MIKNNIKNYIASILTNILLFGLSVYGVLKIYVIFFKHVDFTMKYYILGFIWTMVFAVIETFARNRYVECCFIIDSEKVQNNIVQVIGKHIKLNDGKLEEGIWCLSRLKYPQNLKVQLIIKEDQLIVVGPKSILDVISFELRNI